MNKRDLIDKIQYVFDWNEPGHEVNIHELRDLFLAIVNALPESIGDD